MEAVPPGSLLHWGGVLWGFYEGLFVTLSSSQPPSRLDRANGALVGRMKIQKLVARIKSTKFVIYSLCKIGHANLVFVSFCLFCKVEMMIMMMRKRKIQRVIYVI